MKKQELEKLRLFQGDSPVSRFPLPGSGEALQMTATSGRKCLELSKNCPPLGCLEKMLLGSSIWGSTRRLLIWKKQDTPCGHSYYLLSPSVRGMRGKECLLPVVCQYRKDGDFLCADWNDKERETQENQQGRLGTNEKRGTALVAGCGNDGILQSTDYGKDGAGISGTGNGGIKREFFGDCPVGNEVIPYQSIMGGMADGLPLWMDGHKFWEKEPDGLEQICKKEPDWGDRMFSLGNAVVPQQAYPILKAIADIETGRCQKYCTAKSEK